MSNPNDVKYTSSSMPLPPSSYVQLYSDENLRRGRVPKPPPPPATHETYGMFGSTFHADDTIVRPLESQGIRRLYPQNFDHRRELKKINHSVLVNFMDLLDIMIYCPESQKRQDKIEDLNLLFIHIHHLINEFRPHEARETLRVMMEVQKRQTFDTCERFQKHLEKCVEMVKQALKILPDQEDCKLMSSSEKLFLNGNGTSEHPISNKDLIMCDIMDNL